MFLAKNLICFVGVILTVVGGFVFSAPSPPVIAVGAVCVLISMALDCMIKRQ